jgi:hypothetical protein
MSPTGAKYIGGPSMSAACLMAHSGMRDGMIVR